MVLPFVRDLFADVEKLPAFVRVASHLREGTGRISVSGLTPTAKALFLVLLQTAAGRPLIVVVVDNRTAEDLVPVLQAFHELTGGNDPDSVVSLPTRDVLPFQNLSPHPEIQEERAVALWKIATGAVSILWFANCSHRPSSAFRRVLCRPGAMVRRGETLDIDPLLAHLNTVGYTRPTWSKCPASTPHAEAFSTCTRPRLIARCASSSSAMRSSPSASSIRPPSDRLRRSTKLCCFPLLRRRSLTTCWVQFTSAYRENESAGQKERGASGALRRSHRVSGLGVLRTRRRGRPYSVRSAAASCGSGGRTRESEERIRSSLVANRRGT